MPRWPAGEEEESMKTVSMPRGEHLRTVANALSVAVFLAAILIVFGEGVPRVAQFTPAILAQFTSFALMLMGLVVALFLPPVGGALTLAGFAAFWGANIAATGVTRLGGVFALFPIAAVLQLASWWHVRRSSRRD
jgi:hypothetical protein